MLMFVYICQAPPCFQFTKRINNWNSGKFYLVLFLLWLFAGDLWLFVVVCGGLLVVCGRLWWFVVVCGDLWSLAGRLWSFVVVCGCLLVVCGRWWLLPVLVITNME